MDIADIVRAHRGQLEAMGPVSAAQKRVLTDMAQCRTAALGGHLQLCTSCGYEHPAYNSCRNRHCPKCQALAQEKWIDQQRARTLDVGYFHCVFTLPEQLRPLAKFAPRAVYGALFHAANRTLLEFGQSRLSSTIGATLVLHTWTRDLRFHPHVHAIVSAGGLIAGGRQFRHAPRKYLFPVKAMGRVFRGKMLHLLKEQFEEGQFARFEPFADPLAFGALIRRIAPKNFNVYAKAPFASNGHVLAYLGRYTHRVGIANSRLVSVTPDQVTFRTKHGNTSTLHPVAFLRRFIQHVLPDRFHKIRHVGLHASAKLRACARDALGQPVPEPTALDGREHFEKLTGRDLARCPRCGATLMLVPLSPGQPRAPPTLAA